MRNLLIFFLIIALFCFKTAYGQQVFKLNIEQPLPFTYNICKVVSANEGEVINLDTLLHVEGDISYFYEWSFYDSVQTHAIDNSLLTLTTNGVLYLTIIDENGCTTIDSVVISVITDIGDIPLDSYAQNIQVYPNPNSGTFEILVPKCLPGSSVQVINSLGVLLLNKNLECNNREYLGTIIIPDNESGIYFLLVKKDNKTIYRHKVIVCK